MGEILVRLYGALALSAGRERAGGEDPAGAIRLRVEGPVRVSDLLGRLEIPPGHVHLVFRNRERITAEHEVAGGDTLHVFPPMGGG